MNHNGMIPDNGGVVQHISNIQYAVVVNAKFLARLSEQVKSISEILKWHDAPFSFLRLDLKRPNRTASPVTRIDSARVANY